MMKNREMNNQGPEKFSPDDLKLVNELTEEYLRQKELGGNELFLNHLEWQMQGILDRNDLTADNMYKTAELDGSFDNNEVEIELPPEVVNQEKNQWQTEKLDESAWEKELSSPSGPEILFYNRMVDLYEDYVTSFVVNYDNNPEYENRRISVTRRYFELFDSHNVDNKYKKDKLKELVTDLYRDSIQSAVSLDDFDKSFVKMAMLLQYKNLSTVEKKLKNMPFLGPISHTSDEEFTSMLDIISYRYLGYFQDFTNNIETSQAGHIDIKEFDSANFNRYLNKFSYIFESDVKIEILQAIRKKIEDPQKADSHLSSLINQAYLRAAACHLSDGAGEYKLLRQKLKLGNPDEFELELVLPLLKEKMFVFMKYEEDLKQSKTMTPADRQNVIDFSLVSQEEMEKMEKRRWQWEKQNTLREKDPDYWDKLEKAFGGKVKKTN